MGKKAHISANLSTNKPAMHTANFHQPDPQSRDNSKANSELKASLEDGDASTQSRASFSASIGWKDAVADFLMQVRATCEENTELIVTRQAPEPRGPRKRTLYHPAARQQHKALFGMRQLNHF